MLDFIRNTLIDLIGIDTRCGVAPELPAAQYLQTRLAGFGITCTIYEPTPGRGSMVAVIPGAETNGIVLHAHLDTADFDVNGWNYPPLPATIERDRIYGRGALDCKGLCAVWAGICKYFAEHKIKPQKTIIFAATADEESGGFWGTKWLCENTSLFEQTSLVIGEGGGFAVQADEKTYFTIQTGEATQAGYYNQDTMAYLRAARFGKRRIDPAAFAPTAVENEENSQMAEIITQIQQVLRRLGRNEILLPFSTPGYSDNRFFREMGLPTLGFFPMGLENSSAGIHGADEYVTRCSLKMAFEILLEIVLAFSMPG